MSKRSTPIGFIPGEVDSGAHCMFLYPRRDHVFFERLAGYFQAGLDAGEKCLCISSVAPETMVERLRGAGVDTEYAVRTDQLSIYHVSEVYLRRHSFEFGQVMEFWGEAVEASKSRWNGMRVYGDMEDAMPGRTLRMKLLEYESRINLHSDRVKMALCGYSADAAPRSFVLQMKSVHPFHANVRSLQTNHRYIEPERFLRSLYRFQRVCRVYPASADGSRECRKHLEEIASRTPMTMGEMDDLKLAVGEAFVNALEHGSSGQFQGRPHIHVSFFPRPDGLTVEVRDHGPGFTPPEPDVPSLPHEPRSNGFHLMRSLVSAVDVERRRDETVVSLHMDYAFPFAA
ncbi:MAG: sensor histidine kinase [Armatimonadetes bacterium]|nr:sensor histidine kinase [Armatimonadota bacterium]